MDAFLVPADVETVLAHVGFRPVDLAGEGWLAVALDGSDRRLELHVVPAVADELLSARVARLRALRHEHLAQLLDVVELSPGRLGLVVEHVAGLTLAQVRAARAPLSDGEAATVAIPVAGALGALHDAGMVHGGVTASAVVVRPDGRPVLTDLRGAVLAAGDPEADVRRLVTTVLAQLPSEDVHLVSDAADRPALREALAELLTVSGLEAGRVVDRCYRIAEPEPVRLPDAGALASSSLAAGARREHAVPRGVRRAQRARRRRRAIVVGAAATAVVVVLVGGAVARGLTERVPARADVVLDRDDPVAAAAELTRLRAAAVGDADPAALDAAEVPDGPAHTADVRLLADRAGRRADGLTVDVQDAWLVADDGSRGTTTDVAVSAVTTTPAQTPAPAARTVVLGLRWTDDGWRVWDVVGR
ncbi:hypothetical protein [Cellulomonas sp. P5_E12]